MLKSIKTTLLSATLLGLSFAGHAYAETTLNALFMAQAAYSEADVRAMTEAFTKANPGREGEPRIRSLRRPA